MYVYVCMCMYVCMYVCRYVGMYVCTYVRMYVCMYVRMYVCTYICTYVRTYGYACTLDLLYLPEVCFFLPWCILLRTSLRPRCSTLKQRLNGQSFGEAT